METIMKKSMVTLASALVLSMAAVSTASARDGFYLAVRGGMDSYNLNDKDDSASATSRADFGDVWMMSGAIGYRYSYFRVEAEYVYRDDADDTYRATSVGEGMRHSVLESDSFMANAYIDFMPNYWISPYVSGGIGWTRLDLSNQDTGSPKRTYSSDNFTWSLGGGLSLRLNRCLNLDAGYRYVDMGDIEKANVNAHEYYGGLRFTF